MGSRSCFHKIRKLGQVLIFSETQVSQLYNESVDNTCHWVVKRIKENVPGTIIIIQCLAQSDNQ